MFQRDNDIYATAPLRRLLQAQTGFAVANLKSCSGVHGLMVAVAEGQQAPALRHVSHWVQLQIKDDCYVGALRAESREALPFVDDAFDVVVLQHALQPHSSVPEFLLEVARVLAPGGMLMIAGVHPLSAWAPWFHWKSRERRQHLSLPLHLLHVVRTAGLEPERCSRVGTLWPSWRVVRNTTRSRLWGGGYVLLARKPRRIITPLRVKPIPVRLAANGRFSPGTRRNAAFTTLDP
jgi:SAM-dependent methyltransferase